MPQSGEGELLKAIYLLWPPRGQGGERTREVLLATCAPKLLEAGAVRLVVHVADDAARARSPAPTPPFEQPICAAVSAWVEDGSPVGMLEKILCGAGFTMAGYLVEESIYTDYGGNRHAGPRSWPDGERSPGIVMVTMLERPARLPREEWIRRWHGTMSPVSEAIQPRTRYVRNLVLSRLTAGAPPLEGIVMESWPSRRHVESPMLFYGATSLPELARNMLAILRAVTWCFDLFRIRTAMTSEYFVRTGWQGPAAG